MLGGAAPPATVETAEVTVVATGVRNTHGVMRACMTSDAGRFPRCRDGAIAYQAVSGAAPSVTLVFSGVKPGRYAIALLHDENNNGKADRAAMMIPTEGFGFSRDAPVRFGPPKFAAAAFDVAPGARERMSIRVRYLI